MRRAMPGEGSIRSTCQFRLVEGAHCLDTGLAVAEFPRHRVIARKRVDPREQGEIIHRLGDEVLRAGFQAAHPVLDFRQRGDHHDRDVGGCRIVFQAPAGLVSVKAGHHDVEQNDVGCRVTRHSQAFFATACRAHDMIAQFQLRPEKLAVCLDIVDHQYPGTHAARSPGMSSSTARWKELIWIGLER